MRNPAEDVELSAERLHLPERRREPIDPRTDERPELDSLGELPVRMER